jgi:N-acyl-D-aspartate/D-glutamate deacylase
VLDVVLKGASVVDGTGAPRFVADVGIRDGQIATVGAADEPARQTIDVSDLVVAPGFVDVHTHLHAQLMWDPAASPSTLHGSTTVIGGNCGFSIAPIDPGHSDYIARMLSVVEGIPLPSLRAGVDWEWRSFGEWLGRLESHGIGPNAGFMVGHSTLRVLAMGHRALEDPASPAELETMVRLLDESLAAGGIGFSTSWTPAHIDDTGRPVASRVSSHDECVALAGVASRHPGTMLQIAPGRPGAPLPESTLATMIDMAVEAGRPLNWNTIRLRTADARLVETLLGHCSEAAARGATMTVLTYPDRTVSQLSLRSGMIFDGLPGWADVMHAPVEQRMRLLADPGVRQQLHDGARGADTQLLKFISNWGSLTIMETFSAANAGLAGRTIAEVAVERGADPFDTFLDVSLADELRTYVRMPADEESDAIWALRLRSWRDHRAILGDSDAGAHLDMLCGARCTTAFLGESVRERQLLGLEEAVHLITDRPARYYGLLKRGRVLPGWNADLAVFNPETIGPGSIRSRHDLPGGASRLYAEPTGVEHVYVNGRAVVSDGRYTGNTPGQVLRSGRDTWRADTPSGERS